ncbi:MAG: T9SS type A sorting domain-containing protein [Flavobacteriales bacterium]|jgi:hypothetical protein
MTTIGRAQSIAPQSVNSAGAQMTQANGTLGFTVGELAVLTLTDGEGNTIGSGFTAGATLSTVSVQETDQSVLDVRVFPNPTSEMVVIQINQSVIDYLWVTITDMQGKEIFTGQYAGFSHPIAINTAPYSNGTYVLSLTDRANQLLGSYQIIKQ